MLTQVNYGGRIDDMGRVTIPKELRRQFKLEEGQELRISNQNGKIVMTPTYSEEVQEKVAIKILREVNEDVEFKAVGFQVFCTFQADGQFRKASAKWDCVNRYNILIGMAIAYCRCMDKPIPREFL